MLIRYVEIRQRSVVENHRDSFRFTGTETDFDESFQFLCGSRHRTVCVANIDLSNVGTFTLSRVGDVTVNATSNRRPDLVPDRRSYRLDCEPAVFERCVGQSEAKRKEWLGAIVLVAAIANKNPFFVKDTFGAFSRVITIVNWIVFPAAFEGNRQTARMDSRRQTKLPRQQFRLPVLDTTLRPTPESYRAMDSCLHFHPNSEPGSSSCLCDSHLLD